MKKTHCMVSSFHVANLLREESEQHIITCWVRYPAVLETTKQAQERKHRNKSHAVWRNTAGKLRCFWREIHKNKPLKKIQLLYNQFHQRNKSKQASVESFEGDYFSQGTNPFVVFVKATKQEKKRKRKESIEILRKHI